MKNVIVFGSESTGMAVCQKIIEECPSVSGGGGDKFFFFFENNPKRWNETLKVDCKNGKHHLKVYSQKKILKTDFDKFILPS